MGSINTHREFIARLAHGTRTRCLAIDYRLAPEHAFPAALDDATSAYLWLLKQGIDPSRIIVAGDSAGGGLALSTVLNLCESEEKLPAGIVCISPWTDLSLSGASVQRKAKDDFILGREGLMVNAGYYAGKFDLKSPLISPLFANLDGLPPLLIQVGSEEILLDDSTRFHEKGLASGVDVTLEVYGGMFHVFQLISILPETKKALGQIAEFVTQRFQ